MSRTGRAQLLVVAGTGLASLLICTVVTLRHGEPIPAVHDEFSYLLAADTFAHGRLANPTPAHWESFETFHVLLTPTYSSKFPPGQGLVLALGQLLLGLPLAGVWLSSALACGATAWVGLQLGSLRGGACAGAIALVTVNLSTWAHGYWGGSVAALGGALVTGGALLALRRGPSAGRGLVVGLGASVLCVTRPFEGLVLTVSVVLALLVLRATRREQRGWPPALGSFLAAALLGAAPGPVFTAIHAKAVTGSELRLPYAAYSEQYDFVSPFLFLAPGPVPEYRHQVMKEFFVDWLARYRDDTSGVGGFLRAAWRKLHATTKEVWLLPPFTLVLLLWLGLRPSRAELLLLAALAGWSLGLLVSTFAHPHYAAPWLAAWVALHLRPVERLLDWRWRERPLGAVLVAVLFAAALLLRVPSFDRETSVGEEAWQVRRATLSAQLEATGERHLVLVHYSPDHDPNSEWVENGADLEGAPVLWARAWDEARDAELLRDHGDRRLWRLEVGNAGYRLESIAPAERP